MSKKYRPASSKIKKLKIQPKCYPRAYGDVAFFPEIRLAGKWLTEIGFNLGEHVVVEQQQNKITITVHQPGN